MAETPDSKAIIATVDSKKGVYFETSMDNGDVHPSTWSDICKFRMPLCHFARKVKARYEKMVRHLSLDMYEQVKKVTAPELSDDLEMARTYLTIKNSLKGYDVYTIEFGGSRDRRLEKSIYDNMMTHYEEVSDLFKPYDLFYTPLDIEGESKKRVFRIQDLDNFEDVSYMEGASEQERSLVAIGTFILWKCLEGITHITKSDSDIFHVYEFDYLKNGTWLSEDKKYIPIETQIYYQNFQNIYSVANKVYKKVDRYPIMAPLFAEVYNIIMRVDRANVERDMPRKRHSRDVVGPTFPKRQKNE